MKTIASAGMDLYLILLEKLLPTTIANHNQNRSFIELPPDMKRKCDRVVWPFGITTI
jgi:hypothetical protein